MKRTALFLFVTVLALVSALPALGQSQPAERARPTEALLQPEPPPAAVHVAASSASVSSVIPALKVENATGEGLLRVFPDAGLLATGNFGTGAIPATGAGIRLMWYPKKAAFRAGRVSGTQWDDANVGFYSTAMGQNTTAGGDYSTAMGYTTRATGELSTAMGLNTIASGGVSTAMGAGTTASGNYSTAMGLGTIASGFQSTAMGENTTAFGRASTAMGFDTRASSFATAMGLSTTAATPSSLSLGRSNSANQTSDNTALVVGNGTFSSLSDALRLDFSGNLTIAGTLTQSSDIRLKEDITPLEGALPLLATLQPVRYRFREGTGRPGGAQIGLLAQEVRAVLPELVREDSDGYLSVSYANLSAVLVQAVNEQQAHIEHQHGQIKALTARLDALEAQHAALRAEGHGAPTRAGLGLLAALVLVGLAGFGFVGAGRRRDRR